MRRAGDGGPQLLGPGTTRWLGLSGGKLRGFYNRLYRQLRGSTAPTTIVLHLGSNDILDIPVKVIKRLVRETFKVTRQMLPRCKLLWSDILPRLFWWPELRPGVGDEIRIEINAYARKLCTVNSSHNLAMVHHPTISQTDPSLYVRDGVHLSPKGFEILRDDWVRALLVV